MFAEALRLPTTIAFPARQVIDVELEAVEDVDEPTAITTLEPTRGADQNSVRTKLITEHHVVTTVAGIERAPFEMKIPVLRVSPHVDVTDEELESFAGALTAAST